MTLKGILESLLWLFNCESTVQLNEQRERQNATRQNVLEASYKNIRDLRRYKNMTPHCPFPLSLKNVQLVCQIRLTKLLKPLN